MRTSVIAIRTKITTSHLAGMATRLVQKDGNLTKSPK